LEDGFKVRAVKGKNIFDVRLHQGSYDKLSTGNHRHGQIPLMLKFILLRALRCGRVQA
jgi:hypothetical protein